MEQPVPDPEVPAVRASTDRILTTHAGSLPRTPALLEANAARQAGAQPEGFTDLLRDEVSELVQRQLAVGIDVVGDGEYGKAMSSPIDYGAWWSYSFQRTGGLEIIDDDSWATADVRSEPGNTRLTGFLHRRDRRRFAEAYADPTSGIWTGDPDASPFPSCTGPLSYTGHDTIAADIANLKAALERTGASEGFLPAPSPGSASRITNRYYATEEEFIYAWADVMRGENTAIIAAGLILQIDDPSIDENFDQLPPEPSVEDYVAFTRLRVEALNYALRDLPQARTRFHLCWGSWHGPHTTDIAMADIVDTMLQINAGAYSFEAGNVRHEHEGRGWQDVEPPAGKPIQPRAGSHATNAGGHPAPVADPVARLAAGGG